MIFEFQRAHSQLLATGLANMKKYHIGDLRFAALTSNSFRFLADCCEELQFVKNGINY